MPVASTNQRPQPGMVTSPHPLATEAGAEVIKAGGTAIEAAIAIGSVLTVVTPHFCGLGGDAVWLVADQNGKSHCFLGIGQAGEATSAIRNQPIPFRGPGSMLTTACVVDSWDHALTFSRENWFGTRSLPALIERAMDLAASGYEPSKSQDFWLDFRAGETTNWHGFSQYFNRRNTTGPFKQPGLADSFAALMAEGARSFYEGKLSKRIAEGLKAAGSCLTAADLARTRTRDVSPLTLDYRGTILVAPPPPTQGITTLAIMGILNHMRLASAPSGSAERYHLLVEAVKRAFMDRAHVSDPVSMSWNPKDLLATERLRAAADTIDPDQALVWPHEHQHGDTVFFSAVDRQGRCASVLQSTYFDWGSGVVVGDTGILWQNRSAAFSTQTGHPNCIAPGKLPFYTLNPGLALRDGRPFLTYGTQGADGQPQTLAVLLTALLDDKLTPAQALRQPRFLLGKTFSDARDSLKVEGMMSDECLEQLATRGHDLARLAAFSPIFGQAGALLFDTDRTPSAAHDPRGEGCAWIE